MSSLDFQISRCATFSTSQKSPSQAESCSPWTLHELYTPSALMAQHKLFDDTPRTTKQSAIVRDAVSSDILGGKPRLPLVGFPRRQQSEERVKAWHADEDVCQEKFNKDARVLFQLFLNNQAVETSCASFTKVCPSSARSSRRHLGQHIKAECKNKLGL